MSGLPEFDENPSQLSLFGAAKCQHQPDPRFGFLDGGCVSLRPGVNQNHDEDYLQFGRLVCRLCGCVYVGAYTTKTGSIEVFEDIETVKPSSDWDAPDPVDCPACEGTGHGPARQVHNYGASRHTNPFRTTTSCVYCNGTGKMDPRDVPSIGAEIDTIVDEIAPK